MNRKAIAMVKEQENSVEHIFRIKPEEKEAFARVANSEAKADKLEDIENVTLFLLKRIMTRKDADFKLAAKMGLFIVAKVTHNKKIHTRDFKMSISQIAKSLVKSKDYERFIYFYKILGVLSTSTSSYSLAHKISTIGLKLLEKAPFDIYHRYRTQLEDKLAWAEAGLSVYSNPQGITEDNPHIDNEKLEKVSDKMLDIDKLLANSVSEEYDASEF